MKLAKEGREMKNMKGKGNPKRVRSSLWFMLLPLSFPRMGG